VGNPSRTALLTPSEAVPLAGSVPNLDSRNTAQLTPAKLLHRVDPVVPDFAKEEGIDGTVLLSAVIGTDGKLKDVKFVSGDRALAIEAFRAVRDWRYRPYMLNGKPIEAETRIVMNFKP
jgi:protein TonB